MADDSNPFLRLGATQSRPAPPPRAEKQYRARAQPMVPKTALERVEAENKELSKRYRAYKKAELQAILDGELGDAFESLLSYLRKWPGDTAELVGRCRRADWLQEADDATRYRALSAIHKAIRRVHGESDPEETWFGPTPTTMVLVKEALACP